ncbi:MAG: 2,3-bisphosphoglycerate-independent phosphoglycerate mutase 1 [Parcubacteria group bacterium GW2011_GWC1_41_7]|nr:MAG: 2,3-bisphosphoglycerate-independent phosphoglycerate mutase 1 [Parcubacteria group bacterium GW2011_GWC1_41_7]
MRTIFFLIDGISDFPQKNTPLRASNKPFLHSLRDHMELFQYFPLKKNQWPSDGRGSISHIANFGILGYDVNNPIARGPIEAIGGDMPFQKGELALRLNFATIRDTGMIDDRRAGRDTLYLDELIQSIAHVPCAIPFSIKRTYAHRCPVVFHAPLSSDIHESDPFDPGLPPKTITPLNDTQAAIKSAHIVSDFIMQSSVVLHNHPLNKKRQEAGLLPANYLLMRGPGNSIPDFQNFFSLHPKWKNGIVIAENGVVRGSCKIVGFDADTVPETGHSAQYQFIFETIQKHINSYDLLYIHLKGADEAGHDKDAQRKKIFFEEFDALFKKITDACGWDNVHYIITGDHITDCETGKHEFGAVPLCIISKQTHKTSAVQELSELEAYHSPELTGGEIWDILL